MQIDFEKGSGLVPAVVQDAGTQQVLMLAWMNRESCERTKKSGRATFYSRSREELWEKGETSGNWLQVKEMLIDCDGDTLLLKVEPKGPVCHKGTHTCFGEAEKPDSGFLKELEKLIEKRKAEMPEKSYTADLFRAGTGRISQKVGEEAIELIIGALENDNDSFLNEGADLIYHLLVLLVDKGVSFDDIVRVLRKRHSGS